MRRQTILVLVVVVLFVAASPTILWADLYWDILDETYGYGPGEVSFKENHENWTHIHHIVSNSPLRLEPFTSAQPYKASISGFPVDSDLTIEWKIATVNYSPLVIFVSETNNYQTSQWNNSFSINYEYANSAIIDYEGNTSNNFAPVGFDGSVAHTYRFVRYSGHSYLYLFDNNEYNLLTELADGYGAAFDSRHLSYSMKRGGMYDFYHLKISSSVDPEVVPVPSAVILGSIGLTFSGWLLRKRKML